MQRVEPDAGGAERRRELDEPREIAEIAVPPVAPRVQRVKLNGQHPVPAAIALKCADRFAGRRNLGRPVEPVRQRRDEPALRFRARLVPAAKHVVIAVYDAPKPRLCRQIIHFRRELSGAILGFVLGFVPGQSRQ